MDEDVKGVIICVAAIFVLVVGLTVLQGYFDIFGHLYRKVMGPRKANVEREIFEATKSYNEGKEQDLLKYRLEYLKAEEEDEKEAIASTIRMLFADYDEEKLNPTLKDFLKEIKYGGIVE